MKLLDLMTSPWALLPEKLIEMQRIYATHLRGEKIDVEAIEARLGRPLASEQQSYELREGGVAVLTLDGVMAPKANLMMRISGGVSTQMAAAQVASMRADARVAAVVLAIDSPGGSVLGTPALAEAVRDLAAAKPTVTVSQGTLASAAYWVGSAANAVFLEGSTDQVGSIGVYARVGWEPAAENTLELVRGNYKRLSINGAAPTPESLADLNARLDHLYSVFVQAVADQRGVTADQVLERMADGRVFVGQQALDAGLADGIATVDAMVERLATNPGAYRQRRRAQFAALALPDLTAAAAADAAAAAAEALSPSDASGAVSPGASSLPSARAGAAPLDTTHPVKGNVMPQADTPITRESLERDHAALFAQLRSDFTSAGATAERERIRAVLELGKGRPHQAALVHQLAFDGKTGAPEAALQVLQAENAATGQAAAAHHADAPAALPSSPAPEDKPAAAKTREQLAAEAEAYAKEHGCSFVAACQALGIER